MIARVDDPFERLLRCHRRREERLADLARSRADPVSRQDLRGFFDRSIRRREDDEESSLFPRLAAVLSAWLGS